MRCPDGQPCPAGSKCCRLITHTPPFYSCCPYGSLAVCCLDGRKCCPFGFQCSASGNECLLASALVNNKHTYGRDGTAGIDTKVSRIIPSQQVETSFKRIGFVYTSGDILFPDEKYHCPEGTSPCELFDGIYGCCPIQNKREIKIMETRGYVKFWPEPHSCFLSALENCTDLFLTGDWISYFLIICFKPT